MRDSSRQYRKKGGGSTRCAVAALVLLACAFDANALSAGAPRGQPLIGRPLELVIPLRLDRADSAPCVRAEFMQGDSPGGPLDWRIERTGETSGVLRLISTLPVQEPTVTVQVALGCGEQLARQYVMLAEPANETRQAQAEAARAPELPVALAPLALATSPMLGSASAAPVSRSEADKPAPAPAPVRRQRAASARAPAAKIASGAPAAAAPQKPASTAAASERPHLKLEPIDVEIDESPLLRLSNALTLPPPGAGSAGQAGTNARDVFQALNSTPEQQAAQAQSARAVETELRAMRELVQRYGAESHAATQRLEKVSGERDLVLNLMTGMVVLFGAGFAYLLWLRSRESAMRRAWWEEDHADASAFAGRRSDAASGAAVDASGVGLAQMASDEAASEVIELDAESIVLRVFLALDHRRVPTADVLLGLQGACRFLPGRGPAGQGGAPAGVAVARTHGQQPLHVAGLAGPVPAPRAARGLRAPALRFPEAVHRAAAGLRCGDAVLRAAWSSTRGRSRASPCCGIRRACSR